LCKFVCYLRFCVHHTPSWRNASIETVAAWLVDWETLSLVVYHIPELPQGRWHSWTLGPWQWGSSAGRVLAPTPGSPCPISEPLESSLQDTKIGQFDHCLVWNHKELAEKEHTGWLWNCHPFNSAHRAASKMDAWSIQQQIPMHLINNFPFQWLHTPSVNTNLKSLYYVPGSFFSPSMICLRRGCMLTRSSLNIRANITRARIWLVYACGSTQSNNILPSHWLEGVLTEWKGDTLRWNSVHVNISHLNSNVSTAIQLFPSVEWGKCFKKSTQTNKGSMQ